MIAWSFCAILERGRWCLDRNGFPPSISQGDHERPRSTGRPDRPRHNVEGRDVPNDVAAFIQAELDRAGLPHAAFTDDALVLVVREIDDHDDLESPSEGARSRTRLRRLGVELQSERAEHLEDRVEIRATVSRERLVQTLA